MAAELAGSDGATGVAILRANVPGTAPLRMAPPYDPRLLEAWRLWPRAPAALGASAPPSRRSRPSGRHGPAPGGGRLERYIELDRGPGFEYAGGAAVNAGGILIGMTVASRRRAEGWIVPAETLARVVDAVLSGRTLARPYLGVATFAVALPVDMKAAASQGQALLVTEVAEDSPAGRAGLRLGDVLTAVGGTPVLDQSALLAVLGEHAPEDKITVRVLRGPEAHDIGVTLGAAPGHP